MFPALLARFGPTVAKIALSYLVSKGLEKGSQKLGATEGQSKAIGFVGSMIATPLAGKALKGLEAQGAALGGSAYENFASRVSSFTSSRAQQWDQALLARAYPLQFGGNAGLTQKAYVTQLARLVDAGLYPSSRTSGFVSGFVQGGGRSTAAMTGHWSVDRALGAVSTVNAGPQVNAFASSFIKSFGKKLPKEVKFKTWKQTTGAFKTATKEFKTASRTQWMTRMRPSANAAYLQNLETLFPIVSKAERAGYIAGRLGIPVGHYMLITTEEQRDKDWEKFKGSAATQFNKWVKKNTGATVHVESYMRQDGTRVQGYTRRAA